MNLTSIQTHFFIVAPAISILSVNGDSKYSGLVSTYLIWALYFFTTVTFTRAIRETPKEDRKFANSISWIIALFLINTARGIFAAETYWDYKNLIVNTSSLLMCLSVYMAMNPFLLQRFVFSYTRTSLVLFPIWIFLIDTNVYGNYLSLLPLTTLGTPYLSLFWKFVHLGFSALVMTIDLGSRSNVIRFGIPITMLLAYLVPRQIHKQLFEPARKLLFIIPTVLFITGVTGVFNPFKMDDYIDGDYRSEKTNYKGDEEEVNIKADTRTFIYEEVFASAEKYDSWWFGRTHARGYETVWFADWAKGIYGRPERWASEVGILNIFTWSGIVGVILFTLPFYQASWLAVNRSSNTFARLMGVLVAFRWGYSWVEEFSNFSMSYLSIWLMMGICFSPKIRAMTDSEIRHFLRGMFNKNYQNKNP